MNASEAEDNTHISIGPVVDLAMVAASAAVDAAADRRWFRKHPHAKKRVRPASFRELAATGLPAGTMIEVHRLSGGAQLRIALPPSTGPDTPTPPRG